MQKCISCNKSRSAHTREPLATVQNESDPSVAGPSRGRGSVRGGRGAAAASAVRGAGRRRGRRRGGGRGSSQVAILSQEDVDMFDPAVPVSTVSHSQLQATVQDDFERETDCILFAPSLLLLN